MKVQTAAKKAGQDTKAFCDKTYEQFVRLAKAANIDYDHFIRTTDTDHRFAVQHFWLTLQERGFIYQSKHEGWYSVSDETFYPEAQVKRALDPASGRTFVASVETGKEVEWTSEVNYHFRMSGLKEKLLDFYKRNPNFVVPDTRMKEVVAEVERGLEDLSISRPRGRLNWGIPVPDDDSQTIYVWMDALINYITKAGYPFQRPGQEHVGGWPADMQVVGKDIVRFHCIYWPAFLLALDLPLPKQVLTHAHWTLGTEKMSKSTGNVVNPFFAIDRFGVDAMRYYLAYHGGIKDDAKYDNINIARSYKKGLQGGVGNLASRCLKNKHWSVKKAVEYGSALSRATRDAPTDYSRHLDRLDELPNIVSLHYSALDCRAALEEIMEVIFATNAFLTDQKPWDKEFLRQLSGNEDAKRKHVDTSIFVVAESLRICGLLLQPFMPEKMATLLDMLGVSKDMRMCTRDNLKTCSNKDYGTSLTELVTSGRMGLFPPSVEDYTVAT